MTTATGVDREVALDLYRTMVTIRHFETRAGELFAAGRLPGFIHLSIGQEAVAAGVCAALTEADYLTTTHRGHGHCIAKGGKVLGMMAELYGSEDGYGLGRSGSMHIADSKVGILGANAIVGAGIPMALGGALAAQLRGEGQVAVAFFGEGAVAEGVFHESLNLASLWRLPVVFVCENNGYAELTPIGAHLANPRVTELAAAHGMAVAAVDGNNVAAVLAVAREAVDRGRTGGGPTLIEAATTRWRGHFEGDPQHYRSKADLLELQTRDPIPAWKAVLVDDVGVPAGELDAIEEAVLADVDAAAETAAGMPPSDPAGLSRFVYSDPIPDATR